MQNRIEVLWWSYLMPCWLILSSRKIFCYYGASVGGMIALCILLKCFTYPCWYLDRIPHFASPIPQLLMITNHMMNLIYNNWYHLMSDIHQPWLCSVNHQCGGIVNGTVRPVSRPGTNQRVLYNGHKKVYALKFQSVDVPNGFIANLFGHVEGKHNDSGMLADSGLLKGEVQPITNLNSHERPYCQ